MKKLCFSQLFEMKRQMLLLFYVGGCSRRAVNRFYQSQQQQIDLYLHPISKTISIITHNDSNVYDKNNDTKHVVTQTQIIIYNACQIGK